MQTIHNWIAKRSAGRITITGVTRAIVADGQHPTPKLIKVTGVDSIVPSKPFPVAIDKDGQRWELAL